MLIGDTVYSRSNWNLEVLVFMEGGKPENPEKNPRSKNENQQQTQPTYGTGPESNPGHIGGRRALSPLRHPCSPCVFVFAKSSSPNRRCAINNINKIDIQNEMIIFALKPFLYYFYSPVELIISFRLILTIRGQTQQNNHTGTFQQEARDKL